MSIFDKLRRRDAGTVNRQVFLCYAHRDRELATLISDRLRRAGVRVWMDVASLPTSASLWQGIDEALARSSAVVVLMSPAYFQSEWAQRETASAAALKIPIIPALIEKCEVTGFLSLLNWANLTEDRERGLIALTEATKHFLAEVPK